MANAVARSFDELQDAIALRFSALSPQLQRIARFALEHPQHVALDTVAAAAARAAVQPSAMVRFAQALGFPGYTDMQRIFRDRLVERSASYRERIAVMRRTSPLLSRPQAVLHDFVVDSIHHLSHLEEHVRPERLEQAVQLLAAAPHIYLVAQRRAFPVAYYFAYALGRLELAVTLLDGIGGMLDEQAKAMSAQDVLLAISFRNYSPKVIELAQSARASGQDVVVITDAPMSPLVTAATVAFDLGDASDRPFASLVEPLCLAQALVVSVGHAVEQRAAGRGKGARRRSGARRSGASSSNRR